MRLIDADILLKEGWVLHKMVGTTLHEMPLNHPNVPTVDVDSLNAKHEDIGYEKGYRDGYAEALEVTDNTEPIRHGRWVKPNPKGIVTYDEHAYAECSVCHRAEYLGYGMAYCPNCGAKMDEEVNENEANRCR